MSIPNREEFLRGCEAFEKHEKRDAMYKVATFLVDYFWGNPSKMANGLGVLLLTWNQAFYRYGSFDFDKLEECITENFQKIESFRNRDILSLSNSDDDDVKKLFNKFLVALARVKDGISSPVAVSKALHLLAPKFFPLWDDDIAPAYGCEYYDNPAEKYILFCRIIKQMAERVKDYVTQSDKPLLKLIDEYNYSKYTGRWI